MEEFEGGPELSPYHAERLCRTVEENSSSLAGVGLRLQLGLGGFFISYFLSFFLSVKPLGFAMYLLDLQCISLLGRIHT